MIRIRLSSGRTAIFEDHEQVDACRAVIADKYIDGDKTFVAEELEEIWREGEHDHLRTLILDDGFHRIVKVDRTAV